MGTLSVVINVCNEAHVLKECLESVCWVDEIVITDMHSDDGSEQIYREYTDKVYLIPRRPVLDEVQAIGIGHATQDWVLNLAPDERVSPTLAEQIRQIVNGNGQEVAYRIPFKDFIFGKWIKYTGWQSNREIGLLRLLRRGSAEWPTAVHSQPLIHGPTGRIAFDEALDNAIIHLNYTSVEQFVEKMNRYTTAEALARLDAGKQFRWPKLFYHPLVDFWRRYIRGMGYRDGIHGLALSILMAIYGELILLKMWERTRGE